MNHGASVTKTDEPHDHHLARKSVPDSSAKDLGPTMLAMNDIALNPVPGIPKICLDAPGLFGDMSLWIPEFSAPVQTWIGITNNQTSNTDTPSIS